jgi:hypothetical protein
VKAGFLSVRRARRYRSTEARRGTVFSQDWLYHLNAGKIHLSGQRSSYRISFSFLIITLPLLRVVRYFLRVTYSLSPSAQQTHS